MDQDKPHVLIVDDEEDIVDLLSYNLKKAGFRISTAADGKEGIERAQADQPDVIILDIMMPRMDGLEACRRIRADAVLRSTPILILTARSEEQDHVESLDVGADIYLPKPISIPVLISQTKALVRQSERSKELPEVLYVQDLRVDRDRYLVYQVVDGSDVEHRFPRKEFELLQYLASHPGKVFSRQDLLDEVWGKDVFVVDRTVDVHVRKIREKLGNDYVQTVKGVGYKFRDKS
ncbi:MAG: DNA-binding response regulator [Bacteroidetes bacterium]|nr:DNA-binding response regulator [Bacteroidota bacterium]